MILRNAHRGSSQLDTSFLCPEEGSLPVVINIVCQSLVHVALKVECTNVPVVICWHNPLWLCPPCFCCSRACFNSESLWAVLLCLRAVILSW